MKSVCSAPCVNSPSPTAVTSEKGNFTANTTTNSKHSFREGLFAFPPSLSHFLSLPLSLFLCSYSHCFGDSVIFFKIFFFQKWVHWVVSVDLTQRPPVRKSAPETSFSCKCYLNFKKDVTVEIGRLKLTCCHRSFLRWFIFTSCKMLI